jgi:hypothetical protein
MVDPSVVTTMDGGANGVCVGDHAGDAAFRSPKDVGLKTTPPPNAMDHAVSPGAEAPRNLCNFTLLVV